MGLLNAFSWGYSREDELERELRFWRNRDSELHRQFDADIKRAYAEYKAAYDELRAYTVCKERALAISRAELYEERERVAALEEALKRADEQLAERAVAGSFAIGEPAPDELVVAADDVADAVRGVARALKAASETGSKKGSSEFWASAIGRNNLREYVSAAPCVGLVLRRRMQAAAVAGEHHVGGGASRQLLLRQLRASVTLLLRRPEGRAAHVRRAGRRAAAAARSRGGWRS